MTVAFEHSSAPDDAERTAATATSTADAGGGATPAGHRWPEDVRRAAVATLPAYVLSRLVVFIAAKAATWLFPQITVTRALSGWDGGWYLAIAADGYPPDLAREGAGVRWAFFPGLPAAIRGVSEVTGLSLQVSGILVSIAAGAVAVAAIWLLVEPVLGARVATATAALMCFFPSAFVLSMVYTEGLFLMVSALALLAIARERWLMAGAMASAAGLLRAPGLVLVAVVAVAVLREARARRLTPRMILGLALSGAGSGGWVVYQWVRLGDPMAFMEAQRVGWSAEFVWFSTPFRSFGRVMTDRATLGEASEVVGALGLVVVALAVALATPFVRRNRGRIPIEWWVYAAGSLAYAFSPFWPTGILRYTYALFPLYAVALAQLPRRLVSPVLCASATTMGVLCVVAVGGMADWQHAPLAP